MTLPAIIGKTTTFVDTDPAFHHSELEAHRAWAIEKLGGHVHYVGSSTVHVEQFDDNGVSQGTQAHMTSRWHLAPKE